MALDGKKLPFVSGLPQDVGSHEPTRWPCTGKVLNERKVDYGTSKPRQAPKPSVTGS